MKIILDFFISLFIKIKLRSFKTARPAFLRNSARCFERGARLIWVFYTRRKHVPVAAGGAAIAFVAAPINKQSDLGANSGPNIRAGADFGIRREKVGGDNRRGCMRCAFPHVVWDLHVEAEVSEPEGSWTGHGG